jgi:hypothetical protein
VSIEAGRTAQMTASVSLILFGDIKGLQYRVGMQYLPHARTRENSLVTNLMIRSMWQEGEIKIINYQNEILEQKDIT